MVDKIPDQDLFCIHINIAFLCLWNDFISKIPMHLTVSFVNIFWGIKFYIDVLFVCV